MAEDVSDPKPIPWGFTFCRVFRAFSLILMYLVAARDNLKNEAEGQESNDSQAEGQRLVRIPIEQLQEAQEKSQWDIQKLNMRITYH